MSISDSQSVAWVNGFWEPIDRAALTHDDLGALQGAVIVERLRTVGGRLLDVELHLERFATGIAHIGVELLSGWDVPSIVQQVAERALASLGSDVSVVIVATPGRIGGESPTLVIHSSPMPWQRLAAWYLDGQRIITASNRNVPSECWPIQLKTRSRMHYYLADRHARIAVGEAGQSGAAYAGGVLCDLNGNLTETSTANILLVESGKLISPPAKTILDGISLKRTLRLAEQLQITVENSAISPSRARSSEALLLCGTLGCLWAAASLDDREFDSADGNEVFRTLQKAWQDDVGMDFVSQAMKQSE